jgi:hypothetical protein
LLRGQGNQFLLHILRRRYVQKHIDIDEDQEVVFGIYLIDRISTADSPVDTVIRPE